MGHIKVLLLGLCMGLMVAPFVALGQSSFGMHQEAYFYYREQPKQPSRFDTNGKGIIAFTPCRAAAPTRTVFGYLPYWKYPEAMDYLQYDLLSHIAVFDFTILGDGSIEWPSYWPWTDLINEAHTNGVKVIMTGVNFSSTQIHQILHSSQIQENLFQQIKSIVNAFELQGVNIDFEGIPLEDRGSVLNEFMADLTNFLHNEVPGSEISFAAPAVNWGGWDFTGLTDACDYIFIMGYDFYGSWSQTTGPSAPLSGGSYNINHTVEIEYGPISLNSPHKLILGVPYYGSYWKAVSGAPYATVIDHLNYLTYSTAMNTAQNHGIQWDTYSQTNFSSFQANNSWYQIWFDTDSSLGLKYDLAAAYNYKGIGMWALGYDGARSELWDELRRRFSDPTAVEDFAKNPGFQLMVSPYVGGIRLSYELDEAAVVKFCLYNLSGQLVWQSIPGNQARGRIVQQESLPYYIKGLLLLSMEVSMTSGSFREMKKIIRP